MKNISLIFGGVLTIIACNSYAVTATVTSRDYVDNALATKQAKIPSAGTAGAPAGDSVITYTASSGTIGERGLYTDSTEYDASADGGKLITASALRGAFTTLPETETTKLECTDSNCLLWNIITQTAYGNVITIDWSVLASTNGTGYAAKGLFFNASDRDTFYVDDGMSIPDDYGSWVVRFPYNNGTIDIGGISTCARWNRNDFGHVGEPAHNQSDVQADYNTNMASVPNSRPVGANCYCKMTNSGNPDTPWVTQGFAMDYDDEYGCARFCSIGCARQVMNTSQFRGAVFGIQ